MNTIPPDCAILGLGYLGLPLAQKLYKRGSRVCAVKRSLTSDDINLPIRLDTADLNRPDVFQTAFWQHWADKPTWFCLLPPSPLTHYADTYNISFTQAAPASTATPSASATKTPRPTRKPKPPCKSSPQKKSYSPAASPISTSCGWAACIPQPATRSTGCF